MIRILQGNIVFSNETYIILQTNSGVGYRIFTNNFYLNKPFSEENILLYIHTAVRETSIFLYGFKSMTELELFEMLITVSGVGPKAGINILSLLSISSIKKSIISGDTSELTKVSGIGKKVAEKIILELKNKIINIKTLDDNKDNNFDIDIYETLEHMGFSKNKIRTAIERLPKKELTTEEKIKALLKLLAKK